METVTIFGKEIDKATIPDWVLFIARDSDGTIVGFSVDPILDSDGIFWMMIEGTAVTLWRNEALTPEVRQLSEFLK